MRLHLATAILAFTMALPSYARANDFKVKAPASWKKITPYSDEAIFSNKQSKLNETITLHSFSITKADIENQKNLENRIPELTKNRAPLMRRYGLGGYAVLGVERRKVSLPGFNSVQLVHSRYRDLKGREVQMYERQYIDATKMYVVTYLVDAPALNDVSRAERMMDFFTPQGNSREPASVTESVTSAGVSAGKALSAEAGRRNNDASDWGFQDLTPDIKEEDIHPSARQEVCKDVPKSELRTNWDESGLGVLNNALNSPGNCMVGFIQSWAGLALFAKDLLVYGYNLAVDAQTRAATGAIVAAAWKDPVAAGKQVATFLVNEAIKSGNQTLYCRKGEAQAKAVCMMAKDFLKAKTIAKAFSKIAPTKEEVAEIAAAAKKAFGSGGEAVAQVAKPADGALSQAQKSVNAVAESKSAGPEVVGNMTTADAVAVQKAGPVSVVPKIQQSANPALVGKIAGKEFKPLVDQLSREQSELVGKLAESNDAIAKELRLIASDPTKAAKLKEAMDAGGDAAKDSEWLKKTILAINKPVDKERLVAPVKSIEEVKPSSAASAAAKKEPLTSAAPEPVSSGAREAVMTSAKTTPQAEELRRLMNASAELSSNEKTAIMGKLDGIALAYKDYLSVGGKQFKVRFLKSVNAREQDGWTREEILARLKKTLNSCPVN